MGRSTIQKDLRRRRGWARLAGLAVAFAGAIVTSRNEALLWAVPVVFILSYWIVTELLRGRSACPRCAANLWDGDTAPVGVRTRRVWIDARGLPDRCGGCGLDLTESTRTDFSSPEAQEAWEERSEARRERARKARSLR